jgi:SpoVK/Ycf46/Vps4 family AAA+-type ATPase
LADDDLLSPTLSAQRNLRGLYNSTGFFLCAFFAGPAGAGVYGIANSHRLDRLRQDAPVIVALVAAAFLTLLLLPPPDATARARIIELALDSVPHGVVDPAAIARVTDQYSGADVDALVERAKEYVLAEFMDSHREREISQQDLLRAAEELTPSTQEWLRTARNLVKYAVGG